MRMNMGGCQLLVPFWIPILRHLIFRVPKKGTIILTTTHISRVIVIKIRSRSRNRNGTSAVSKLYIPSLKLSG